MTKDKKNKKNYKKSNKKYKRKNAMTGPFRSYSGMDPFAPFKRCKMIFSETMTLRCGALVFGTEHIYRLNNPWDARYALGGDSVYGWDQCALLYNKYKVNAVKFRLIFTDPTADGLTVGATIQPPNAVGTLYNLTPGQVLSQPMSLTRVLNNSGSQKYVLTQRIPIHVLMGVTKLQYKSDISRFVFTSTGSTPATDANVCFIRIASCNDRGSTTQSVLCRIQIEFDITWFNRNQFQPSV